MVVLERFPESLRELRFSPDYQYQQNPVQRLIIIQFLHLYLVYTYSVLLFVQLANGLPHASQSIWLSTREYGFLDRQIHALTRLSSILEERANHLHCSPQAAERKIGPPAPSRSSSYTVRPE